MYGVEIVPQAIEDAKNNAKLNGITNAQFFVGKAEEVLPQFYENAKKKENITDDTASTGHTDMLRPDVIVVDPPRKGCEDVYKRQSLPLSVFVEIADGFVGKFLCILQYLVGFLICLA